MRIVNVEIEGVGPFEHLTLPIRNGTDPDKADVIVIAGPNGSGKSTLLYAIAGCFGECQELADRFRSIQGFVRLVAGIRGSDAEFLASLENRYQALDVDTGMWTSINATSLSLEKYDAGYHVLAPKWWARRSDSPTKPLDTPRIFAFAGTRVFEDAGPKPKGKQPQMLERDGSFPLLRDWLSDVMGRRDAALSQGIPDKAAEIGGGIRKLEGFLADVTGRPVAFTRDLDDGIIGLAGMSDTVALELLPEGLKSMLSWLGDLLRRLYSIPSPGTPQNELPFVLLLDEIDVHLHPKWQRLIVPAIERLFPKAQVFITTHSPFVIFSASDAQIVWLDEGGKLREDLPSESLRGYEYGAILELMGIDSLWDATTKSQFEALNVAIAGVRTGTKTRDEAVAVAGELPDTPDVKMTVDMLFDQLDRDLQRR